MPIRSYRRRSASAPGGKPPFGVQINWSDTQTSGLAAYYLLNEGAGPPVDLVTGRASTVVGTPAWQTGPFGPQVGGFSTSNYFAIDPPKQILYNGTFPCWSQVGFVNTNASKQCLFSAGSSTASYPTANIQINVAGTIYFQIKDNTGTQVVVTAASLPLNDGLPHVIAMLSVSASLHYFLFDGRVVGSSSTTLTTPAAMDTLTLGLLRSPYQGSLAFPMLGSLFAAAFGYGAAPDMATFASDWLSGTFSAVRPDTRPRMMPPASSPVSSSRLTAARLGSPGITLNRASTRLGHPGITLN